MASLFQAICYFHRSLIRNPFTVRWFVSTANHSHLHGLPRTKRYTLFPLSASRKENQQKFPLLTVTIDHKTERPLPGLPRHRPG